MYIRVPALFIRATSPVVRTWWRIRKPRTWGVKALLTRDGRYLVVRHAYGDLLRWGLPGGSYNPNRETPTRAVAREVHEELGITIDSDAFTELDTTVTTLEGKRDTLTILTAPAGTTDLVLSPELSEARWITHPSELGPAPVSRWLTAALRHTEQ